MGEEDKKVICLPGKVEVSLRKKMFGEGGPMEEKVFSEVGKGLNKAAEIARKALGGK